MRKLLIILFIIISTSSFAQQNREIGIDLYTSIYELSTTNPQRWGTLKLNYKQHESELVQRWHLEVSYTTSRDFTVLDTIVPKVGNGITLYYINHTRRPGKLGLYYGMEKKQSLGKGEFYYGGDAGVRIFQVISGPRWRIGGGSNYPGAEQFPEDKRTADVGLIITPFTGIRFPVSKKIWFNVELGTEVNYMITNRPYYRGDGNWEDAGRQYFDFPALQKLFINNIGFSYRF
ncbi:MAG: hypothetical protein AB8G11_00200 [Saprospiraceae bacterium]